MDEADCADVVLLFHDSTMPLQAHKIVLSSVSNVFKDIFSKSSHAAHSFPENFVENASCTCTNTDRTTGNGAAKEKCGGKVEVTFNSNISKQFFEPVLEFLYTGLPGFNDDTEKIVIAEVLKLAEMFHLSWLVKICVNILKEEDFLNPSIGTYLNDETGKTMKELFMDKQHLSDVAFCVEGRQVYAHKAVLVARSSMMAAMVGGAFIEGITGQVPSSQVYCRPVIRHEVSLALEAQGTLGCKTVPFFVRLRSLKSMFSSLLFDNNILSTRSMGNSRL